MSRIYPKASTDAAEAGVPSAPRFPEIELRVLAHWEADETFRASVQARPAGAGGADEFVFYDGPPFANGLPHYGHLLTGYVKDLIPRYQTMRGRRVERRFGWDTHGLPAELEAMRQLGISTKEKIEQLGVAAFNDACRSSVLRYTQAWQDYVTRQARWVDFEHDFKTLDLPYMESVMWAFKQLYDKGLVYEGYRCLPYCWNDETPLSAHELRMDEDVYRPRRDPAVTVGCRLETGELALIWTTTPWTLPSNLALAVHGEIDYVVVASAAEGAGRAERYLLAEERLAAYAPELGEDAAARIVRRCKGSELVGLRYTPPFSYFLGHPKSHVVLHADFVTTADGTGIVHIAPAFGEEDKQLTDQYGVVPVVPVGPDGRFTEPVAEYAGQHVFEANAGIIEHLRARTRGEVAGAGASTAGTVLLRQETYEHSYPHCWRCRNPLIYRAVSSWFVATTAIRDRMLELNERITWVPEHVKHGQFGAWLGNTRDWSISRNRYWGSPIPVWKSDDPRYPRVDVYGSLAALREDFGVEVADLHRPAVDALTRPNPDDPTGRSAMRRVTDVLDCWFESGSMPFAQVHYPFENAEWFDAHFPGDFIVEYLAQVRGWFYTMHVLAVALFDRPSFSTCLSHGIVLGSDGQKMSKSLRNYPDVGEVFERDGADAMRWFLMSSPILRGGNLIVTEQGIREGVRQVLIPLWNSWYFFQLYANAAGYEARTALSAPDLLDRYLLAKLRALVETVQERLDGYGIAEACDEVRGFLDLLTNWYIRRSRERFWGTADAAADPAPFDTLYTALETACRVAAPLLPLISEEIWRGLTGGRSVHLAEWPQAHLLPRDEALVSAMDRTREVCSVAAGLRKANDLRVRLPLAELTVVAPGAASWAEFAAIMADEVNVRTVTLLEPEDPRARRLRMGEQLTVIPRVAGPRLGPRVQKVIRASKAGDWSVSPSGTVVCGGVELEPGEYVLETVFDHAGAEDTATAALPGGGFVLLDTAVTAQLAEEGLARDAVRAVQQARRAAGLGVSDRISLLLAGTAGSVEALRRHRELLARETLAVEVDIVDLDGVGESAEARFGRPVRVGEDQSVRIAVTRIEH
jgi:isoleucyl-tRNA synthetase